MRFGARRKSVGRIGKSGLDQNRGSFSCFSLQFWLFFLESMKKHDLYVGIDGGGSKTAVVLADHQGITLARVSGGPSNFQIIGTEKASSVVFSLIEHCCATTRYSMNSIVSIVAGLSGAGRESDRSRMRDALIARARRSGITFGHLVIESDARVALEGAFRGKPGIILIAGTGSIALGKALNGSIHRVGGWGRVIGDEGSGYAIGQESLNVVSRHHDGRISAPVLAKLIAERFGLDAQERIITAVYREQFDLASLVPVVLEAAEKGDVESRRIVTHAAVQLSEMVRALVLKLEGASRGMRRQKLPLAMLGGLLTNETVLTKILAQKIVFSLPQITISNAELPPEEGALLLAMHTAKTSNWA